jgi:oligopeptide transport system ATP-binding protein
MTSADSNGGPNVGDDLVVVEDLVKHFDVRSGRSKEVVRAVDGISFSIKRGETLGVVGESGCGKSTTARLMLRLIEPTSGSVKFEGQEILGLPARQMRELRQEMQIVFQDPYASLNPRMTVADIIGEGPRVWGKTKDLPGLVRETMVRVGLNPDWAKRYPHEFSGGQRQRIGIARALALQPKLIICDEPVSALDVSVQAQILNLLKDLQAEFDLTLVFIAHDLSVVQHISDRVAVMYLGKIVELGNYTEVYRQPSHPYTRALLSAVPVPDPKVQRARTRIALEGDPPSPMRPPSGCRFHPRCPLAESICSTDEPPLTDEKVGHLTACHFAEPIPVL